MRRLLPILPVALGLMTAAAPAQARVHKCVVEGKVSYQSLPCSAGADAGLKLARDDGAGSEASARMPWSGLKAGMSMAEVQKRVPGTTPPLTPGRLSNGAEALLVKEVQLAGMPFRAQYFFLDGGYYQVSVTTEDPMMRRNDEIRAMYGKVQQQVLQALGQASGEAPLEGWSGGLTARTEWKDAAGNDRAWVSVLPGSRGFSLLTVGHRPEGAPPFKRVQR